MSFLLDLPIVVSVIIVSVVTVGLALLGVRIVRKRFPQEILKENHEVAGFIFNAFGLIYAVLVAFVVFVSWSDYSESKRNTEIEANLLADLVIDARGLPDTMKTNIRRSILEYVDAVINDEWPAMDRGERSKKTREQLTEIWRLYLDVDVKSLPNEPIYTESITKLNQVGEYRRLRLFSSNDFIPGFIWFVLIVCAVASVSYTFFFGVKNIRAQYVMTGVLTLVNTLILLLILILDHPFDGTNAVSSDPFKLVLYMLQHMLK